MGEILTEDKLEFDFRQAVRSIKFDVSTGHGLSHCMKAVDFVVEEDTVLYFVEVKDLDNVKVPDKNRGEFVSRLLSGELISSSLIPKARDSFLYNYLLDQLPADKPIIYIVLLACTSLQAAQLDTISITLKSNLPLAGPNRRTWLKPFFHNCIVLNLESWNRSLSRYPIRRLV